VFERKDSTIPFLPFLDDLRYAGATIVALCSQGLSSKKKIEKTQKKNFVIWVVLFVQNINK
jgi:hypothetical protein